MNLRDQAIIDWAKKNRPDTLQSLKRIMNSDSLDSNVSDGLNFLLIIGFEAGRKFQAENRDKPLDKPSIYLEG